MEKIILLFLTAFSLAAGNCRFNSWKTINYGGRYFRIAANMKSDRVWGLSQNKRHKFEDGHLLVYFRGHQWVEEPTQLAAANEYWNVLAVSPEGEPAFVTTADRIQRKVKGKWEQMQGCATGVAIGPDGTLYRRDCDYFVHKYVEDDDWVQLGENQKVERISVSEDGSLWIRDKGYQILRLQGNRFVPVGDAGFNKFALTTGPDNTVLVTSYEDDLIYSWNRRERQWEKFESNKPAFEIAISLHNRVLLRGPDRSVEMQIYDSDEPLVKGCQKIKEPLLPQPEIVENVEINNDVAQLQKQLQTAKYDSSQLKTVKRELVLQREQLEEKDGKLRQMGEELRVRETEKQKMIDNLKQLTAKLLKKYNENVELTRQLKQINVKPSQCPHSPKQFDLLKKMFNYKREQLASCHSKAGNCYSLKCSMPMCTSECHVKNIC